MGEKWIEYPLRNIAAPKHHSFTDGDWVEAPHIRDRGIRLIQTGNIGVGRFINRAKKYISQESFDELGCTEVWPGDILICRLAEPIGRACFAPDSGERMIASVDVTIFRVNIHRFDPAFVCATINTPAFLRRCELVSGGTTRQRISRTNLGACKVSMPALQQQRRIAQILSTVDEAIERTEALIAKTRAIKAGLMYDLFTRGVTPDGTLRPPREEAPELYKESKLGWIPREWGVVELQGHSSSKPNSFVNGPFGSDLLSSELRDSGIPVLYVQDVKSDGFKKISFAHVTERKADELAFCNVLQGDVLVAKVGSPPGDAATYAEARRAVVTQDVIRIRPASHSIGVYIAGLLNSSVGSDAIRRIMIEGTRGRVSLTDFKRILVPKPSLQEQKLVAVQIENTRGVVVSLSSELNKLHHLKSALMHDLLTGRVRVPAEASKAARADSP